MLSVCNEIAVCDEKLYIYRIVSDSAAHKKYKKNLCEESLLYLECLKKQLDRYNFENKLKDYFMDTAFLNVRKDWLLNVVNAPNFYAEIKEIKSSQYYDYKVSEDAVSEWKKHCGKTARIIYELERKKWYHIIFVFVKMKNLYLKILKKD